MMEKNMEYSVTKIEKAIKELPEKAQGVISWVIMHFGFVEELCKNPDMTNEEIEKHKECARAKEDYLTLALLCAMQTYNNDETPEQETDNPRNGTTG